MKKAEMLVQGQTCAKFSMKSYVKSTQIFKYNGMLKWSLSHDTNE